MPKQFNPKVSIVIPVYNGSNYVKEAIDSALAQTYKNTEVIVINDGSNDKGKTDKICKSYGKRIRYFKKENGGVSSALNMGIEKMEGEYFSWLSHDDVYYPEKVEKQIKALSKLEDKATVIFSDFSEVNSIGEITREVRIKNTAEKYMRVFLAIETIEYIQGCSLLIAKKLFERFGNFSKIKKCTQDYYMWFKLASHVKFFHLHQILVKTRIHDMQDSISKAEIKKIESDIMRASFVSKLTKDEFLGYFNKEATPYWSYYNLYKSAGYKKLPFALVNKMHEFFGNHVEISIIVPIYNVEQYVSKCLDSIIEQKFLNFEVIAIDDGSEDKSGEIADKYAEFCPFFVHVIHKNNEGLGRARATGFKYSKGEYIGFVDSDDYIHPEMFEKLHKKSLKGADIIICGFTGINDSDGSIVWEWNFPKEIDYRNIHEIVMHSTLKASPNACNKIFRRELLGKMEWGGGFYEDLQAVPIYLSYAKKVEVVFESLYYYRINRKGSIMSTRRDDKRCLSFIESWENLIKSVNPKFKSEIIYAVYVHIVDIVFAFPAFLDEFMEFFHNHEKIFRENLLIMEAIKNKKIKDLFTIEFIPKRIHYIWFGDKKMSEFNNKCLDSWREFAPEYKIIKWDETNCNIKENKYVENAYKAKKWAFVSDYFRFKIIEKEGGFYVDTDVEFHQRIDSLRLNKTFFGFEKKDIVQAGNFGSVPHAPVIKEILHSYEKDAFVLNNRDSSIYFTIPQRITGILREKYKLRIDGTAQNLEGDIQIYPVNELTLDCNDKKNIMEHHYDFSWGDNEPSIPYKYYITLEYFRSLLALEDRGNIESDMSLQELPSRKIVLILGKFKHLIYLFKIQGMRITCRNIFITLINKLLFLLGQKKRLAVEEGKLVLK